MPVRGEFWPIDRQPEGGKPAAEHRWLGLWLPAASVNLAAQAGAAPILAKTAVEYHAHGAAWVNVADSNCSVELLPGSATPLQTVTIILIGGVPSSSVYGEFGISSGVGSDRMSGHVPYTDGTVYWDFGGLTAGTTRLSVAGLTITQNDVWAFTSGPRGMEIWQNGRLRASNAANPTRTNSVGGAWGFGANGAVWSLTSRGPARWYGAAMSPEQLPPGFLSRLTNIPAAWGVLFEPLQIDVEVPAPSGAANLTIGDASHAHTVDSLTLTTSTTLAVADATHGHAADALTLSTGTALAVAEAAHAHAADAPTLSVQSALTVADATHAHTAEAPVLTVQSALTVADASHGHAADAVTLTAASALAVADATHGHAADNVVLSVAGATNLTVADALHAHAVDALALTSAHALIVADATHGHSVDGLTLTAASVLAIQDALHAHAADGITLYAGDSLLIADALHAHTSDGVALTVAAWLVVGDATHANRVDNLVLTLPGAVTAGTPRYTITARPRRLQLTAAHRRLEINR